MPGSHLYRKFKAAHCTLLVVHVHVTTTQSLLARMKSCAGRKRFPYWFGTSFSGSGKEKLGLSVQVERVAKNRLALSFKWFPTQTDPPETFGRYSDLADCMREGLRKAASAGVVAVFAYEGKRFASLFKPIPMEQSVPIFDEIVGVSGVKRDSSGKPLYRMELSFGDKALSHSISFAHTFDWSEECVKQMLDKAVSISGLALVPR